MYRALKYKSYNKVVHGIFTTNCIDKETIHSIKIRGVGYHNVTDNKISSLTKTTFTGNQ